ncbi:MAG: hypothetical protein IKM48_04825 [Clostridia bacterium]|nr:hypothetical protein [Clostridia bacterium]
MSKFLVGWAEESLVPEKKVSIPGQFYERISEYVEDPISATAMAVESGNQQAIFVSCDMTGFGSTMIPAVRAEFAKLTDEVEPEKLIINATHTHTSVGFRLHPNDGFMGRNVLVDFLPEGAHYEELVKVNDEVLSREEALVFLSKRIAKAAYDAWNAREEAMYANAFGRAVVGFCRRVAYDDGTAQMWGDTNTANFDAMEGGNDSGIEMLFMFNKEKKLTGVVANIACPSQILEHRSFLSADYWGKVKENLRKEWGEDIYLLALGGAGGDQCPRDLVRWVEPETPINDPNIKRPNVIERVADPSMFDLSGCRRVGKRVANEIIAAFEELGEPKADPIFIHERYVLDLPLRRATITEYNNAVREIEYYINKQGDRKVFNYVDKAAVHVQTGLITRFRQQQNQETVPTEVHILRLGDVAFATNPFELFLDYGNRIKARSYAKQTFITQLCCGGLGYLPTEKAEKGGHYSAYISSGNVGYEGGDQLVRKSAQEINKLFKEEE